MSKQPSFGGWFQCRNLDKPEWWAFKTIRTEVLPEVSTRDAMHVLVRLAAEVAREPNGRERLLEIHRRRLEFAPSETEPLI